MTFATIFLSAFASWSCGSPDGTSDSTLATHTASDEVTSGADGGTEDETDGGKVGKGAGDMDGGCGPKTASK
jgi:hypothetical protein